MRSEALVDSYLQKRYKTPAIIKVSSTEVIVPTQVFEFTSSVLRYKIYSRRPHVPDNVIDDYKITERNLLMVSRGSINIIELEMDSDSIGVPSKEESQSIVGTVKRGVNNLGRKHISNDRSQGFNY